MNKKHHLYSSLPMLGNHKTYAEIDLGALKYNYKIMRGLISEYSQTICVLKADAYGHGAKNCCRALLEEGCRYFAVSSIEEAIDIREVCHEFRTHAEILILGYTLPSQAALLAKHDIITSLPSAAYARELATEAKKAGISVRCQIKLDTGMNRIGFAAKSDKEIEKTVAEIAEIFSSPSLDVCGMFTHLAKADEALDEELPHLPTDTQVTRFIKTDKKLCEAGIDVGFRHVCNSAAAMRFPEYHFDACRLGITLYGTHSSRFVDRFSLRPVMRLCTIISHIHTLTAGESVSYGGTYTAKEDREVATLPIGYADGFVRDYSSAFVSVETKSGTFKAPILGRICMDQCMIDITGSDAQVGDRVVIFGNDNSELSSLAQMADTIEYECLCLVTSRVPRIYFEGRGE